METDKQLEISYPIGEGTICGMERSHLELFASGKHSMQERTSLPKYQRIARLIPDDLDKNIQMDINELRGMGRLWAARYGSQ